MFLYWLVFGTTVYFSRLLINRFNSKDHQDKLYFNPTMRIFYSIILIIVSIALLGAAFDFIKEFCFKKEHKIVI